jgi:hypothetical protein
MNKLVRFSEVSAPRQALMRLCQVMNYGQIRCLIRAPKRGVEILTDLWAMLLRLYTPVGANQLANKQIGGVL